MGKVIKFLIYKNLSVQLVKKDIIKYPWKLQLISKNYNNIPSKALMNAQTNSFIQLAGL